MASTKRPKMIARADALRTGSRESVVISGTCQVGERPAETVLVTDLGILKPDPETREFTLVALHPGVTVQQAKDATGWPLKVAADLAETPPPTAAELEALRALHERTRRAHDGG